MTDWQQRVVDEANELATKIGALRNFIAGPTYAALPHDEALRLQRQLTCMGKYHEVLVERIEAFSP